MILYHGTPASRGEQIILDRSISSTAIRLYGDDYNFGPEFLEHVTFHNLNIPKTLATTDGYVYLSHSIFYAIFYGNKNAVALCDENEFYLFRIDVPDELLEPDYDEIIMTTGKDPEQVHTAEESLQACLSVRVPQSLSASEFKIEYLRLPCTINETMFTQSKLIYEICSSFNNEFTNRNPSYIQSIKEEFNCTFTDWTSL